MKRIHLVIVWLFLGLLISSCGAIPTLPPLDSTVTIITPQFTISSELATDEEQVDYQGTPETSAESPSAPPETVSILPQPTATQIQPSITAEFVENPTPTKQPTSEITSLPEPTSTETPFPYQLQVMNPHYLGNFTHPELGCNWMGIGGQIFNREGVVQKNIIIKVGGELAGSPIVEEMTMPLAEPEIDIAYGPGGYELTLANAPVESDSTVWIQLFSLEGIPLSEQIYMITYDDCQKNLLLMNFTEE